MFVICINYNYAFVHAYGCINLSSLLESYWTKNLRILHSPLTTGEWTGAQAILAAAIEESQYKTHIVSTKHI